MYSASSEKLNSIERVGSHATKHSSTGKGGVLPPEADPWAAIFLDLKSQKEIVNEEIARKERLLGDLNWTIRGSSDPADQRRLLTKRRALAEALQGAKNRSSELADEIRYAAKSSIGQCFMHQAYAMLLPEQFSAIRSAAMDLVDPSLERGLRRPRGGRKKRSSEMTPEQRAALRRRESRKNLANKFGLQARNHLAGDPEPGV